MFPFPSTIIMLSNWGGLTLICEECGALFILTIRQTLYAYLGSIAMDGN